MKKYIKLPYFVFLPIVLIVFACKQSNNVNKNQETILKGSVTILVDETLKPIIEDQIAVFESKYEAKITLDSKSEAEVIKAFLKDTASIAILTRPLTSEETKAFGNKKITPKFTIFRISQIRLNTMHPVFRSKITDSVPQLVHSQEPIVLQVF